MAFLSLINMIYFLEWTGKNGIAGKSLNNEYIENQNKQKDTKDKLAFTPCLQILQTLKG